MRKARSAAHTIPTLEESAAERIAALIHSGA
jgi:hypothetical protein